MVGQYVVVSVVEVFYVFDDDGIGVSVLDVGVYGVQVVGQVDYFWFVSGVLQYGMVVGQCGSYYQVFGVGYVDGIEEEVIVMQVVGWCFGFDVVVFDFDLCVYGFEIVDMQVDWM